MDNEAIEEQKKMIEDLQTKLGIQAEQIEDLIVFKESVLSGAESVSIIGDTDIRLTSGKRVTTGDTAFFGLSDPTVDQQFGFMSTGKDLSEVSGYDLTEVITWYDGTLGLSAFYGRGGPILVARDATTVIGSTTISSPSLRGFADDALVNKIITVKTSTTTNGYTITANSGDELSITGGTPTVATTTAQIEILNTVYLGSGSSPWKRSYVEMASGGGLRFGLGSTANGQNGLLYATTSGGLYYRQPDNTVVTIVAP